MTYIAVDQLEPGMVLSEDVLDINTRLLLSRGQKIIPNHIRVLKIWGVNRVNVVGPAKNRDDHLLAADPGKQAQVQQIVDGIFRNLDREHAVVREIYRTSLTYRLEAESLAAFDPIPPPTVANRSLAKPRHIGQQIQKIDAKLPEAPFIVTELNHVIADDLSTSNDVARVVNKSPSLAAVLLKIVNSAFYGFPSRIDRISRAVTIIGTKQISGIALGICVMQAFKDIPSGFLDPRAFLRHSLACGITARILAAFKNLPETEQLFVSGLLHDIGKLIVLKYYPEHAREAIHAAIVTGRCVYETEMEIIGLHHTKIGRHLIRKWGLPAELESNIVHHHAPANAQDPVKAGIVQLADLIVHGLGIGSSGELAPPCLDAAVLDELGIDANAIPAVVRQTILQLSPLKMIFED